MLSRSFAIISRMNPFIWSSLVFNMFGLKMFIDVGSYNIFSALLFFHFIVSILITIGLCVPSVSLKTMMMSFLISLTVLPSIIVIMLNESISLWHVIFYFSFLFSLILTTQFILKLFQNFRFQLFYTFVLLVFLWGTNLVIESYNSIYDILAPLSISYHYSLVAEGILHVGTIGYIVSLPLLFYGCTHAKKA